MPHDALVHPVRGSLSFWAEYGALADDDPRKRQVRETAFALVESGANLPGSSPSTWPWGDRLVEGRAVDLEDGSGFIAYAELQDPRTGEGFIGLIYLIWYPGD